MDALTAAPEPLPRAARWAVFGVLTAFLAVGLGNVVSDRPVRAGFGAAIVLVFAAAAIFAAPRWTVAATLVSTAGVVLLATSHNDGVASDVAWFVLVVLAAWCVHAAPLAQAIGYWAVSIAVIALEWLFAKHDGGWVAWAVGITFGTAASLLTRRQRHLVAQLRAAQVELTQRAQSEERARIARELHDVIAHSLTVSLLHVSSARLAVADDPAEAERALAEAERLGRASLDEVRHAVGLLRTEADPTAPLPGSLDVPALLERFRSPGMDVRAEVDGELAGVPATVGLATYRILQEALTNAVKHAPGCLATVRLVVTSDGVTLEIDTDGAPGGGAGHGLAGMRERAVALGGTCSAGPGGAGWLVRAELPLDVRVAP